LPSFVVTVVWRDSYAPGRVIAEELAMLFEGAEDEPRSAGLAIPTRVRCVGADPTDPLSPPAPIPTDDDIVNIVVLLVEPDLVYAFSHEWAAFANGLLEESSDHPERMLVLPITLGDRRLVQPLDKLQSIATSLFPGSGAADPAWMRRLVLTVVAHLGNYLRRLEQYEKDRTTPFEETLLSRFPIFISHAKRDGLVVVMAIRDHLANNAYGVDTFIDAKDLPAGLAYEKQFTAAIRNGAVVALRTDAYSSRPWCRWETLEGKRLHRPIVVLDLLRDFEVRVNPYGGNVPSLRMSDPSVASNATAPGFDRAILLIMTEAARVLLWNRRVKQLKSLAEAKHPGRALFTLARAPELVDIANIRRDKPSEPVVVLHPGPSLSEVEGDLVAAVAGDLVLCAPSDLGVSL
jgi:TIR domain